MRAITKLLRRMDQDIRISSHPFNLQPYSPGKTLRPARQAGIQQLLPKAIKLEMVQATTSLEAINPATNHSTRTSTATEEQRKLRHLLEPKRNPYSCGTDA